MRVSWGSPFGIGVVELAAGAVSIHDNYGGWVSSFVFVTTPGGGNAIVMFRIARRLLDRGHDVHIVGDAALSRDAESIGATSFTPFETVPSVDWREQRGRLSAARMGLRFFLSDSINVSTDVLRALSRLEPDAIAVDVMLPGALIAAEKSGRPSATIVHSVWFIPVRGAAPFGLGLVRKDGLRDRAIVGASRLAFDLLRPSVNRARRRLGLRPVRHVVDQFVGANRTLVLTDPRFDTPPEPLPEGTVYTGPELDRDPAPLDFPLPDGDEPLVLVALSTTDQHQTRALRRIAEAIALVGARAVITTGPIDPVELHTSPKVAAMRSAPHATILPDAAVVVTHGGHGTTMEALAAGVPLLFMPFGRDQPEIASRVVRRGAGLRVSRRARATTIAAALGDLLNNNHQFRANAATLACGIAEDTAADRAIGELEALATGQVG